MKFSRKFFGSLQVHTGYLTFSLKKTVYIIPNLCLEQQCNKESMMKLVFVRKFCRCLVL